MKKIATLVPMAMLTVASIAPTAFAAGDGGGNPLLDFIFKAINFIVLVGLIYHFAKKPVGSALRSSAETARKSLEETNESRAKAEAELKEFKTKLDNMKQEAEAMIAKAKSDAEAEKKRIITDGEEIAKKLEEQVRVSIEQEYRKAQLELRQWTAENTVKQAEASIKKDINKDQQQNLVKNYLSNLN